MARSKKKKFEEVRSFSNVFEWNSPNVKKELKHLLKNYERIVLELGCGKGEYTLHLSSKYPDTLVLGVDIQGERIWKGAKDALEKNISNAYFLRIQVENIMDYFPKKSVDEVWITFPDPFPRERQEKKRLTSPRFLNIYKSLLKKNGMVHLKTDSQELFDYTLGSINNSDFTLVEKIEDIYLEGLDINPDINEIQTTFETKHLKEGRSIKYLQLKI